MLALYGIGNIVGVGIYVLIGQIAGFAGYLSILSFVIAALVSFCAALSYAELATRFPVSAGFAVYLHEAFRSRWLSTSVGLLLVGVGAISTATLLKGFTGYFHLLVPISPFAISCAMLLLLTVITVRGIRESVVLAALLTILEIGGLVFLVVSIIWSQPQALSHFGTHFAAELGSINAHAIAGIISASFVAFYAFVGFEDTVNIAEEVRHPRQAYPRALLAAMCVVVLLYIALVVVVLGVISPQTLMHTDAPLAQAYQVATGRTADTIIIISLLGTLNGMIVTMIMGSRFLYGLATRGWINPWFSHLSSRHVPARGLIAVAAVALMCALWLPIERSAQLTSLLLLMVFLAANVSLILIRRKDADTGQQLTPGFVPWFGAAASGALLVCQLIVSICHLG